MGTSGNFKQLFKRQPRQPACHLKSQSAGRRWQPGKHWQLSAFTYIEVLITLAMLGILFIPMMQLFSYGLSSPAASSDLITACHLARREMEKVKNLNLTTTQLKKQMDLWTLPLEEPPLKINQRKWRVLRHLNPESNPLEVYVEVFSADNLKEPLVSLVTLIGDNIWEEAKEGL